MTTASLGLLCNYYHFSGPCMYMVKICILTKMKLASFSISLTRLGRCFHLTPTHIDRMIPVQMKEMTDMTMTATASWLSTMVVVMVIDGEEGSTLPSFQV